MQDRFKNAVQYDASMGKVFALYDVLHVTVLSYLSAKLDGAARGAP